MSLVLCKFFNCKNVSKSAKSGLCGTHAEQMRVHGTLTPIGARRKQLSAQEAMPQCSVSHCALEAQSRAEGAMCSPHYQQKWRGRNPEEYKIRPGSGRGDAVCLVDECVKKAKSRKVCSAHRGSIAMGMIPCPEGTFVPLNPKCSFFSCEKRARSVSGVSLCHGHYVMDRDGLPLTPLNDGSQSRGELACIISECKKVAVSRRLCRSHFPKLAAYKITVSELINLMDVSECQNLGCGNPNSLYIDHDHSTGLVRDMLCSGCNSALGFAKESAKRLRGLADYVEKHSV